MIFCLPFINLDMAKADPMEDDFFFDVDITSGPTSTVCPGQEYTFTASSSSGGCFYWDVTVNGIAEYSDLIPAPGYSCGSFMMAGDFKIYPNPAEDQLSIELTNDESTDEGEALSTKTTTEPTFTVLIYNKQQRLMAKEAASGDKKEIDVSALPSDTYLLHIQHKGKTIKEQIVIQ